MRKIVTAILLMLVASMAIGNSYSEAVKVTAVESQGDDISVYVSDGSAPLNPGSCGDNSSTQLFLAIDSGTQRSYSALLTALASKADVQLLLSASSCRYNKRVVVGVRILQS